MIWTSDHGYQLGQFRLPCEKEQPYDNHIRVLFFVHGPNIPPGSFFDFVASMVDVDPTIGSFPSTMDERSFSEHLTSAALGTKDWGIGELVNHYIDLPNNTFVGVRLLNSTHSYL